MGFYAPNGMYYSTAREYRIAKDPLYLEKKRINREENARKKAIAENKAIKRGYEKELYNIRKEAYKEFESVQKKIDKQDEKQTQDMVKRHFGRELPIEKMRFQGYDHSEIREIISNYEAAVAPGSKISPEKKKEYKEDFYRMQTVGLQTIGEIPVSTAAQGVPEKTKIPYLKKYLELEPTIDTAKKMGLSGSVLELYEKKMRGLPGNAAFKRAYEKNSKNPEKELLQQYGKIDASKMLGAISYLGKLKGVIEGYKKAKDPANRMDPLERRRAIAAMADFRAPEPPKYKDVPSVKPSKYIW